MNREKIIFRPRNYSKGSNVCDETETEEYNLWSLDVFLIKCILKDLR